MGGATRVASAAVWQSNRARYRASNRSIRAIGAPNRFDHTHSDIRSIGALQTLRDGARPFGE